jgi:hypothetical protein
MALLRGRWATILLWTVFAWECVQAKLCREIFNFEVVRIPLAR